MRKWLLLIFILLKFGVYSLSHTRALARHRAEPPTSGFHECGSRFHKCDDTFHTHNDGTYRSIHRSGGGGHKRITSDGLAESLSARPLNFSFLAPLDTSWVRLPSRLTRREWPECSLRRNGSLDIFHGSHSCDRNGGVWSNDEWPLYGHQNGPIWRDDHNGNQGSSGETLQNDEDVPSDQNGSLWDGHYGRHYDHSSSLLTHYGPPYGARNETIPGNARVEHRQETFGTPEKLRGPKQIFPFDRDAPLHDAPLPPWAVRFVSGNEPKEEYIPRHYSEEEIQTGIAKYNAEARARTVSSEIQEVEVSKMHTSEMRQHEWRLERSGRSL